MKKYISISIICLLVIFALYNSVYFEKLDEKKESERLKEFNPKKKAAYFWDNKLDEVIKPAIDLKTFDSQLAENPGSLLRKYGKTVGITTRFSFLVKGITQQVKPGMNEIPVELSDGRRKYNLVTKYIFGNAARDATGYFKVNDFENTMNFNAISTELNNLIARRVIVKIDSIPPGESIKFIGALEIDSENIPDRIDIVPLKIEFSR